MDLIKNLLITTCLLFIFSVTIWGQHNKLGKVIIFVSSTDDEVNDKVDIQPYRVYLKGDNFFEEMVYLKNQIFELDVPQGIYNIVLKENVGETTLPYQRANFNVTQDKTTELRIDTSEGIPQTCNSTFGVVMLPTHTTRSKNSFAPKYDKVLDNGINNLIVKYCQKKTYKKNIVYKFVLLTYKNINIYADKLTVDKENLILKVNSNSDSSVWVEAGNCRKEKRSLNLNKINLENLKNSCVGS